jgi:RNA polymerase sigma-70 factor (ECF subfamily)
MRQAYERLIQEMTANQDRLYGFIFTLLPNHDRARDVLQETNLTIWRKADEFRPDSHFWAWAAEIAYRHVRAHYRDQSRERLVFDDAMLSNLRDAAIEFSADDEKRELLRECLKGVQESQLKLLVARYRQQTSLEQIARDTGRTVAAVKMILLRLRKSLLHCVERKLAQGGAS